MSPEHAAERLDLIGPATDIYGLSATLDVVLTGWPPFVESDAGQVLPRCGGSSRNPRRVNRRVPRPLDAVCLKAMARDPNSASPAATALADASSTGWPTSHGRPIASRCTRARRQRCRSARSARAACQSSGMTADKGKGESRSSTSSGSLT
jgi:hypothetical protein